MPDEVDAALVGRLHDAISLQGRADAAAFISSFTGSHRFVLDYLIEEVLRRQTDAVQSFLLGTSLLERMCGPLCDAVTDDASVPGAETLERLERANLFVVPLDDERRWYRYHRLFADALRQRLRQGLAASGEGPAAELAGLHGRASAWYEENGLGGAGGEALGGPWVFLVGLAGLGAKRMPRALGWLGVVTGIVGLASNVPPLRGCAAAFGVLQIPWLAWLGVVLLRTKPDGVPAQN